MSSIQSYSDGRLLLLGASGMLGHRLMELLGPQRAVATYHSSPFSGGIRFDSTSMRLKDTLLRTHSDIRGAVILLGITKLDLCARDPVGASRVNVQSIKTVIDDLVDAGIKPLFASSDAVFDGSRGMWTEHDVPNPILAYGRQKLESERHLASKLGPWVIARLAKVVSHSEEKGNLFSEWAKQFERSEAILCATDSRFTPIDSRDAATAIARLASENHAGIFHLGGPRALTRIELLETLISAIRPYREISPQVVPCRLASIKFAERRPTDLSMSSRKLSESLNMALRDPSEVCDEFVRRRFGGWS